MLDNNNNQGEQSQKTYTQAEVDAMMSQKEERLENKYNKKYVDKNDYESLKAAYQSEVAMPKIKHAFIQNGGNEEAFDGFIKVNGDLVNADPITLNKRISDVKASQGYFFKKANPFSVDLGGQIDGFNPMEQIPDKKSNPNVDSYGNYFHSNSTIRRSTGKYNK